MNEVTGTGDVYTMAEAARLKGVSYHTVSRAVRRGKLPATRLGRMALITSEDLRDGDPCGNALRANTGAGNRIRKRRQLCSISPPPSASSLQAGWHHYPKRSMPRLPGCREKSSLVSWRSGWPGLSACAALSSGLSTNRAEERFGSEVTVRR